MPVPAGVCFYWAAGKSCPFANKCKFAHARLQARVTTNRQKTQHQPEKSTTKNRSARRIQVVKDADPMTNFFATYIDFEYEPLSVPTDEFKRLQRMYCWDRNDPEGTTAWADFRRALVKQFEFSYGAEVNDVESWRGLCVALDILPLPENVLEAQAIFLGRYVNLVDLVHKANVEFTVAQFATLQELQEYTIESGKFFPKDEAYAGGLLRYLLREITGSYGGKRGKQHRRQPR